MAETNLQGAGSVQAGGQTVQTNNVQAQQPPVEGATTQTDVSGQGSSLSTEVLQTIEQKVQEAIQARDGQWQRYVQSRVDQGTGRVERNVNSQFEELKRSLDVLSSIGLDAEQLQSAQGTLINKAISQMQTQQPTNAPQDTGSDEVDLDALSPYEVSQYGGQLAQELGLTASDPEVKMIGGQSPYDYVDSIRFAAWTKKNRLAQQQTSTTNTAPTGSAPNGAAQVTNEEMLRAILTNLAQTPGLNGGGGVPPNDNPLANINDMSTLRQLANKELADSRAKARSA